MQHNCWSQHFWCTAGSAPWRTGTRSKPAGLRDEWRTDDQSKGNARWFSHYNDVIMSTMASQITGVSIVYLTVCSCADQRKHQNSASLAFVRGIHRLPVNSPHKGPVTRKMFPFDDVIMIRREFYERTSWIMCIMNGYIIYVYMHASQL